MAHKSHGNLLNFVDHVVEGTELRLRPFQTSGGAFVFVKEGIDTHGYAALDAEDVNSIVGLWITRNIKQRS